MADDEVIVVLDLPAGGGRAPAPPGLGSLGVGLTALRHQFRIMPTFTAKTQFLPPQQQQGAAQRPWYRAWAQWALGRAAAGLKNPADQYVAFVGSVGVA
jgi:hypothetical protein